jgi:hypothetical protein
MGVSDFRRPAATLHSRGDREGLKVRLGPNVLRHEIGVLAQAVAKTFYLEHDGVVKEAVQQGRGDHW